MSAQHEAGHPPGGEFVEVRVITTAAVYPNEGFEHEPGHQKLSIILKKAQKALEITDTSGFVVRVNGELKDPEQSYVELGLSGNVDLHWGPDVGAGGCA